MGQRHQIFVKIPNPVITSNPSKDERKELVKHFGTGKYTILAYHNQWLYGRSALQNCLNLLKFASQFTIKEKTEDKYGSYDSPITYAGQRGNYATAEKIATAIGFIMNYRPVKTSWLSAGIGGSWYLNKTEPYMRSDFKAGDNNDGITIVDMVENKYCFMNIFENTKDRDQRYDVMALPELQPVDARAYVSAYYGETIERTNPYSFGDHDRTKVVMPVEKQQEIVNNNIKTNIKASKGFNKFEVLTLKEIQTMFTKMELIKKKAEA